MSEYQGPQASLTKTKWGFYQYKPNPSEKELVNFYAKKYYQQGIGSYETSYSDEEIAYFRLKARLVIRKCSEFSYSGEEKAFIDIGCGEGWLLDEFYRQGWNVSGIDFSSYGINKFNPQLLPFFKEGNIYKILASKIDSGKRYHAISLANVIEHVIDPAALLNTIKKIMHKDALLVIIAPNDFSPLHKHLLRKGLIAEKFWLDYPHHLSYFNKESMTNLLVDLGFRLRTILAENPIDLNLLNDNSNYIRDRSKGKATHFFRVRADNFLASIDLEKLLQLYETLGSMGVGRDLVYYCFLAP